jgi:hypothetical protein
MHEIAPARANEAEIASDRPARRSRRPGEYGDLDRVDEDELQRKPGIVLHIGQVVGLVPGEPENAAADDHASGHESSQRPA